MPKVENVDQYILLHSKWKKNLILLREMLLSYNLSETIKWGAPVYTKNGKNLIGIAAFKNHYGLWFFQGTLLKKNTELLVNSSEGKSQAMRQLKLDENFKMDLNLLKKYVEESIELHDKGKTVKLSAKKIEMPIELKKELENNKELEEAFNSLTPGKQREYSLYVIEAKREATKLSRLQKIIPMILAGIGLNDKYKNC
tara:strand:- start:184 stop:777 length:594 start_codon:yes stop_codon:yes gene_type:complete